MAIERVPTGIPGLDKLLDGGFPKGAAILVTGAPGCGKTIFAMQYIANGAIEHGEKGVFIVVEQNLDHLHSQFTEFGYDLKKLQGEGKIAVICLEIKPELGEDFLQKITSDEFKKALTDFGAKRVSVDPLNLVMQFSADYGGERRGMQRLINAYKKLGCTTIFTHERSRIGSEIEFGVQDFVVDGIIYLELVKVPGALSGDKSIFERRISILKMRETDHSHGLYHLDIQEGGIQVDHGVFLKSNR